MKQPFNIIHQTEDTLVINKAAGLLSLPDRYNPALPNLYGLLHQKFEKVYVVHRLDKDTSGVMVFALTAEAHQNLSLQFQSRTVKKTYLALVEGCPQERRGSIQTGLEKVPGKAGRMRVNSRGKAAVTHYKVLQNWERYSLLSVSIETGRTHQVRVHLSHIGHPIVGDPFYGNGEGLLVSKIKGKRFRLGKNETERPLIARTALHAQKLGIALEGSTELTTFEAPLPKDFRAAVKQLDKWLAPKFR
ncbi:MAG TPA: RluA family pseudouridine synthase [Phaeodactylibacter sp.]|nr:RluA family pseudouridine synthase [Phaeodactylibacter sp.]